MACFVAPMVEAIVITVVKKVVEKKEQKAKVNGTPQSISHTCTHTGIKWSQKLGWLNQLLWGGVFLLAIEHIWHGEVVPFPPFLTAMNKPADVMPMLKEIALYGTSMAVLVTLVWVGMVIVAEHNAKSVAKKASTKA